MLKLLAPFLLLLLLAAPALADRDCVTIPVRQRIAHGVYLQQLALHCEQRPAPKERAAAAIQRARDWIGLCREAGGPADGCAAALADLEAPVARDALRVARSLRAAALVPIEAPLAASPAAAPRWETPRLLTNAPETRDGSHP